MHRSLVVGAVVAAVAAVACRSTGVTPTASGDAVARAQGMTPTDARLAGLYAQSCKACHTSVDSGAPLAGDRTAWDPRWAKGMPALLQSTAGGVNGMPAGGQCFACSPADYEALIRFMAAREPG